MARSLTFLLPECCFNQSILSFSLNANGVWTLTELHWQAQLILLHTDSIISPHRLQVTLDTWWHTRQLFLKLPAYLLMCHKVFFFYFIFCVGRVAEIKGSNLHPQWASDCCNYCCCVTWEKKKEKRFAQLWGTGDRGGWLDKLIIYASVRARSLTEQITKSYTHMQPFAHVQPSALEHSAGAAQVAPCMKCTVYIKRTPLTSPIACKWWCTEIFCHYKGRTKELTWKRSQ